ncbi:UDP-N-acetylmuramoyl-L-alanyl-D-glutamate--2, 6-diaminopimelate ligase [Gammaproteobacteria bacterium]
MSISLCTLLEGIVSDPPDQVVSGLSLDSRKVRPGDLFFAFSGQKTNGAKFIDEALSKGAVAVLEESVVNRFQIGQIASRFYQHPSHHLTIVGVTGTNGKTTITHLVAQALEGTGHACAVAGTLGTGRLGELAPATHTTPDAISLQSLFAGFANCKMRFVAMEVSSHALDQGRVEGTQFHSAIFTNLTRDHLDYHGDMQAYGLAKKRLFHFPNLQHAIINVEDSFGEVLVRDLPSGVRPIRYGLSPVGTDIFASNLRFSGQGLHMEVQTPVGSGILNSPLLGRFNAYNLLAALSALLTLKIPLEKALDGLSKAGAPPGRMELFGGGNHTPKVVVDFAHTPDALEQALTTLREHATGQLWCVFGCGGERDKGKRAAMGTTAERFADQVVLTHDNPRNENPTTILENILSGMSFPKRVSVIPGRAEAIRHAILTAKPDDIVLLAGKGHENCQQIGKTCYPFSDRIEVQNVLKLLENAP